MREVRGELVVEGKLGGGMRGEGEAKKPVGLGWTISPLFLYLIRSRGKGLSGNGKRL